MSDRDTRPADLRWLVERAAFDAGLDVPQRIELWHRLDQRMTDDLGWVWRTTEGQRKAWDGDPDLSAEGWFPYEWERHEYTETIRWIRPTRSHREPDPVTGFGPLPPGTIIRRPARP